MENTFAKKCVTADLAAKMVAATVARAKAIGVPQIVAILDESGLLKAFHRMDGAPRAKSFFGRGRRRRLLQRAVGAGHRPAGAVVASLRITTTSIKTRATTA